MGRARWAAREYDLPHFSPTRSTNSSCPLWSFLQTAQAIARQSYLWVEPHPRSLGLHQNTPSGRKVARHRGNGARAYTHSLPPMPYRPLQFGFMLALLPIGYQYEPFCFVCAGRGNAPAPLLYTDQVYHLITPRGAHGSALAQQHGCPVTARSRQHSRLLLRIVPVTTTPIFAGGRGLPYCVVLLDAGCLATSSRVPAGSSTDTVQEYGHHQHHLLGMYSERAT